MAGLQNTSSVLMGHFGGSGEPPPPTRRIQAEEGKKAPEANRPTLPN